MSNITNDKGGSKNRSNGYKRQCLFCNKSFTPIRVKQLFCPAPSKCRMLYWKKNGQKVEVVLSRRGKVVEAKINGVTVSTDCVILIRPWRKYASTSNGLPKRTQRDNG